MSRESARRLLGLPPGPPVFEEETREADPTPKVEPAPEPRKKPGPKPGYTPTDAQKRARAKFGVTEMHQRQRELRAQGEIAKPMVILPDRELWERQQGEPARAFAGFVTYRDMPLAERGTGVAHTRHCELTGVPVARPTWFAWVSRYRWHERVEAYDLFIDRRVQQERLAAIRKMQERHVAVSGLMQNIGVKKLNHLQTKVELDPESGVTVDQSLKLLESGIKLERQARGEPTEVVQHRGDPEHPMAMVDVGKLLSDRLRDMAAAIRRGRANVEDAGVQSGEVEVRTLPPESLGADGQSGE